MASTANTVQIGTYGNVAEVDVCLVLVNGGVIVVQAHPCLQSAKAAAALMKWKETQKKDDDKAQLFDDATEDFILQVTLRKMPEKKRLKPVML